MRRIVTTLLTSLGLKMNPHHLQWLDVSANLIDGLGNYHNLGAADNFKLLILHANGNRITKLTPKSLPAPR